MEQFYHLIFLGAMVLLFRVGLLPYIAKGRRNSNYVHKIDLIPESDKYWLTSDNDRRGVKAQERSEWLIRWLVPGLLVCWLPFVGAHVAFAFLLNAIGTLWTEAFEKAFDGFGHTIEIVTVDDPEYEKGEIERMRKFDSKWREMTEEEVTRYVNRRKPLAKLWKAILL